MSVAPTAPSTIFDDVTVLSARPLIAAGRGDPDPTPEGVNTNVPLLPWSSLHDPPSEPRSMAVVTWTGVPLGGVTMANPRVTVPVGFGTAIPSTAALVEPPHWLS